MSDGLVTEAVETPEVASAEAATEGVLDSTEVVEGSQDGTPPDGESETPADASTASGERLRDAQGRFTKPQSDEQADGADGVGQGEGADVVPSAAPVTQDAGQPVPIRVDGTDYELPGAVRREDGHVVLTPDGFEQVHRWMGKGLVAERKLATMHQQLQQVQQARTARDAEVERLGELYAQMAELDDEQLAEVLRGFRQELPVLREQIKREHLERELEAMRRAQQPDPAQQQEALRTSFVASFNETWEGALRQPWAKGLTPDDQAQLRRELEQVADSFLYIAPADDPQREIRRGEHLFNDVKMEAAIKARAEYVVTLRRQQAQVAQAQAANARKATVAVGTPQGAPRQATPSHAATRASTPPKSRDEWLRKMGLS